MAKRTQWKHGKAPASPPKHLTPWQHREAMRGVPLLRAPRPFQDRVLALVLQRQAAARAKEIEK
jgi:hypothetical protein